MGIMTNSQELVLLPTNSWELILIPGNSAKLHLPLTPTQMETACASSCDLQFLATEDIPKLKMQNLRYLLDYQQLGEEWNPASMKKADLIAAVQALKDRGPLTSAQIFERFAIVPEDQSGTEVEDGEDLARGRGWRGWGGWSGGGRASGWGRVRGWSGGGRACS